MLVPPAKKCDLRVLGIIVVYDEVRSPIAVARFKTFLLRRFSNAEIRIVSNNLNIESCINGSNVCGEFSGWAEGLSQSDLDKYQLFVFANDTFANRNRFDHEAEETFVNQISEANRRRAKFIVGEVGWHIDYHLAAKRRCFLIKWIRTSIFAMSTDALRAVKGVSLPTEKIDLLVKNDDNANFMLDLSLPEVVRKRIDDWLRPVLPGLGWHGASAASKYRLTLKAKCVLQELLLSKRCTEMGVTICSTRKQPIGKELSLHTLFFIQQIFKLCRSSS